MKDVKEAAEKNPDTQTVFVSQVVEGSKGATFYVSTPRSSMAGFDHNPTLREILATRVSKNTSRSAPTPWRSLTPLSIASTPT